jgi:repressor of nif and glnA expression
VTLNGVLLRRGIPIDSVFGGLLEMQKGRPARFTEIIHYAGTSIDPLEIFIKGRMTSVRHAARQGSGKVGASFREIPAICTEPAAALVAEMEQAGLYGVAMIGRPGRPVLEVPVSAERVGVVVFGGLNPLAAAEEAGITTQNHALTAPFPFKQLVRFGELQ